jgi:hypothetical protein
MVGFVEVMLQDELGGDLVEQRLLRAPPDAGLV